MVWPLFSKEHQGIGCPIARERFGCGFGCCFLTNLEEFCKYIQKYQQLLVSILNVQELQVDTWFLQQFIRQYLFSVDGSVET